MNTIQVGRLRRSNGRTMQTTPTVQDRESRRAPRFQFSSGLCTGLPSPEGTVLAFVAVSVLAMLVLFSPSPAFAQANPNGDQQSIRISRSTTRDFSSAPAEHFTGSARVEYLFRATEPARASGAYVTFEPGARSAWHTHPLGQTLIVTAGVGRVQQWGAPIEEIRPGDVVRIPPSVKHWHGAAPDSSMTHLAIQEALGGKTVDWLEKVSEEHYAQPLAAPALGSRSPAAPQPVHRAGDRPTPAQRMFGDIAPKLAELTDDVLYADVWERQELSKRDRSLVTVSALLALNRPEQLRSHLARARENGLTEAELVEAITHLAFYAGWPNAVTAVSVAKEVFGNQ